jgi:hypothetical protein
MPKKTETVMSRLYRKIHVDEFGCWIFTGAIDPETGYGRIGLGGRGGGTAGTHRVSYADFWDEIPNGLHIDHLCRNRKCCNPLHLEAITQAENNQRSWDARNGKVLYFSDQFSTPSRAYLALVGAVEEGSA